MINRFLSFPAFVFKSTLKSFYFALIFAVASTAFGATPVDVNTATAEQLAAVMVGIGQKKAQAIVRYRDENGEFSEIDELIFVKGIGPILLKKNRAFLSIGPGEEYKEEKLEDLPL